MSDGDQIRIPEQHVIGKLLGRHINHDPESRNYRAPVANLAPRTQVWRRVVAVFNQKIGACTGNAVIGCAGTSTLTFMPKPRAKPYSEKVAVQCYSLATQLDPFDGSYPPDDTGSDGLSACKAAVQMGYATSYYWGFGIDDLVLIVSNFGSCAVGTDWHPGMDDPDPSTGLVTISGKSRGGHEWQVLGYHLDRSLGAPVADCFEAQNSWGRTWGVRGTGGRGGRFFIRRADMAALLKEGGDCVTLATDKDPTPIP